MFCGTFGKSDVEDFSTIGNLLINTIKDDVWLWHIAWQSSASIGQ
jgi:hypothetical protein